VFGTDAKLGVSEVIGCEICHEGMSSKEGQLKQITERESALIKQLVAFHGLSDADYEDIQKQCAANGEPNSSTLEDAVKKVRAELIELHKSEWRLKYGH